MVAASTLIYIRFGRFLIRFPPVFNSRWRPSPLLLQRDIDEVVSVLVWYFGSHTAAPADAPPPLCASSEVLAVAFVSGVTVDASHLKSGMDALVWVTFVVELASERMGLFGSKGG